LFGNLSIPVVGLLSVGPRRVRRRSAVDDGEFSETAERYVETVYRLHEGNGAARTGEIAEALGVTGGSVTNTITNLQRQGLFRHKPYRGVELTPRGRVLALRVLRKHRLAERLLTDVIGMKWSELNGTASNLSHAISDELAAALERLLKNPKTCPHGNPIPTATGKLKQTKTTPLDQLNAGQSGTLVSVSGARSDLLRHLESLGLVPGVSVRVEGKDPFTGAIIVNKRGSRHPLGKQLASLIQIRKA
jgi:DtxR family Mn-dependent transcriptional regulator